MFLIHHQTRLAVHQYSYLISIEGLPPEVKCSQREMDSSVRFCKGLVEEEKEEEEE
jgi:hypothetical protein